MWFRSVIITLRGFIVACIEENCHHILIVHNTPSPKAAMWCCWFPTESLAGNFASLKSVAATQRPVQERLTLNNGRERQPPLGSCSVQRWYFRRAGISVGWNFHPIEFFIWLRSNLVDTQLSEWVKFWSLFKPVVKAKILANCIPLESLLKRTFAVKWNDCTLRSRFDWL